MVHLLQVSVILSLIALGILGFILYDQYYGPAQQNVTEIIEIIANQSQGSGGGAVVNDGQNISAPGNITLPSNVQILQNTLNDTRYTAILITENLNQTS